MSVLPNQFTRWGDYSNTSIDPIDSEAMCTIQQFVPDYANFGMQVTQLLPNNKEIGAS